MGEKVILDACCGSRMFWFDKKHPLTLFADIRNESHILCDGRELHVKPDVISDFRKMSFPDNQFKLVVFDPPHLKNAGSKGWQAKKYGSLTDTWREDLKAGFDECMRVLDLHGILIFKWNEHSIKVSEVIKVFGQEPLVGHRTGQSSKTMWMAFMKMSKNFTQLNGGEMKRYDFSTVEGGYFDKEEVSNGDYVLFSEVEPLIVALKKIRDQDYRGNKPESIAIAEQALQKSGVEGGK